MTVCYTISVEGRLVIVLIFLLTSLQLAGVLLYTELSVSFPSFKLQVLKKNQSIYGTDENLTA